jgi:uncharacterized protein (DUF4415 family)
MKENDIVSYSSEELKKQKSRTDFNRIQSMTEAEIDRLAMDDPDAPVITRLQWEKAMLIVPGDDLGKERISLWIDQDVLNYFGKGTKGYQKRLNSALRRAMVTELLYNPDADNTNT